MDHLRNELMSDMRVLGVREQPQQVRFVDWLAREEQIKGMQRNECMQLLIMIGQLKEAINKFFIKLRCPTTKIRLYNLFF